MVSSVVQTSMVLIRNAHKTIYTCTRTQTLIHSTTITGSLNRHGSPFPAWLDPYHSHQVYLKEITVWSLSSETHQLDLQLSRTQNPFISSFMQYTKEDETSCRPLENLSYICSFKGHFFPLILFLYCKYWVIFMSYLCIQKTCLIFFLA